MANAQYISAGQFKAQCLKIMDEVQGSRKEVVITKYGKPVAKLVSFTENIDTELYGFMASSVVIKGDILSTGERWEADER